MSYITYDPRGAMRSAKGARVATVTETRLALHRKAQARAANAATLLFCALCAAGASILILWSL
jgi:hypothetical protein